MPPSWAARARGYNLAHAFVNDPLDMAPKHPSEKMPLVWRADDFGYYCFRSGWAGGEDGRAGHRPQEPVVLLPDDQINQGSCAHLVYLKAEADGSAVMTMDMNDVYATVRTYEPAVRSRSRRGPVEVGRTRLRALGGRKAKFPIYDGNLLRCPDGFGDSGVTSLRAIAFDYSGRSGAPCLVALVDKIDGGGRREWLWPVAAGSIDTVAVHEDGQGFTSGREGGAAGAVAGTGRRAGKAGGEAGIRTRGAGVTPLNGLANRRFRPLSHLSAKGPSGPRAF